DLRTDLPKYRVWEKGELLEEPTDITSYWRDDLVAFLLGCSFTFESALLDAGIPVRHIECGCNVPMYITNIQCVPAGRLSGPMVVSMRPIPARQVPKAVLTTGRFPAVHGSPVHIGEPSIIGIKDINKPDFGDPVTINPGEVPVFWACGVTPQAALMASKPPFAITHAPGHMFVCDPKDTDYAIF
ncbi:MAG: putative hydro-lyase, partial [Acetomicrobium sp.]